MATEAGGSDGGLHVIGLCAAWCGVCRTFAPTFAAFQGLHQDLRTAWLDMEEVAVAAALGDVDVETFPTVVIGRGQTLLFWGAILPKAQVLERLVHQFLDQHEAAVAVLPEQQQAWQALRLLGVETL